MMQSIFYVFNSTSGVNQACTYMYMYIHHIYVYSSFFLYMQRDLEGTGGVALHRFLPICNLLLLFSVRVYHLLWFIADVRANLLTSYITLWQALLQTQGSSGNASLPNTHLRTSRRQSSRCKQSTRSNHAPIHFVFVFDILFWFLYIYKWCPTRVIASHSDES